MTKRKRLIWKTVLFCSVPVAIAAGVLALTQNRNTPYVPGQEKEGITRTLDRRLDQDTAALRFVDVTEAAGIRFDHFPFRRTSQLPEDMGSGVAWGDYDGDGRPDLFLVNFAAPIGVSDEEMASSAATDRLYRNRGDGTFEDVTAEAGVGAAHRGMGAAWGDFDSDGDLDLFVTSWGENILWENRGDGTFRDVTGKAGLAGADFWAGASWADFDLDGDLDLYVCGYVDYEAEEPGSPLTRTGQADFPFTLNPSSYLPRPNRLYVNMGDGTFEDRAQAAGVLGDAGRSLSAAWVDLDDDGRPDLYVANDVSDNALYRNRGDGTFEDVSYRALIADYRGSMGLAVGDWDGDLDLDLYITHWIAQENALYSNLSSEIAEDGSAKNLIFGDDADQVGLGQIALNLIGWGTAFADLDNDGWLDLVVANGSTFQDREDPSRLVPMNPNLFWNRGAQKGFYEVGTEAGLCTTPPASGRGVALADYDGDGDLDVAILGYAGPARLLRNESRHGHWIGFRLRGHSGHASGLGARIVVYAGGRGFLREAGAGASYLSQSFPDVLVGLGTAASVDSVTVRWPRGRREVLSGLAVDRLWALEEGAAPRALEATGETAAATATGRRTSQVSEHAVVADLSSALTREDKRRFWELSKEAGGYFGDGDWEKAIPVFDRMLEIDPLHEDALYYKGNCLLELGRYREARDSWRRLLQVNPMSSRALVQIGIVHTQPEAGDVYDLTAAVAAFRRAHEINREESRPLILWGEAALAQGDLDAATEALGAAYRMNPQSTSALYLSGYIAWKRGNADLARTLLDRAVRSVEENTPAPGVSNEGDTRSAHMRETRRQAAARQLFSGCIDALRASTPPLEPGEAYAWVDDALVQLPGSSRRPG